MSMPSDKDISRKATEDHEPIRKYRLVDIPGYMEWSERKLDEGGNEALIAHLDATSMFLPPADLGDVSTDVFDEMFMELKAEFGDDDVSS